MKAKKHCQRPDRDSLYRDRVLERTPFQLRSLKRLIGGYELFPKPLGGDTSAFSECREFRPDDVRIDRGLSYPSSVSAITAGD
jgi:hypothetical protein